MYEFLEDRAQEYYNITKQLKLPEFINQLPTMLQGNPYHNSHHLYTVAINSYKLGKNEALSHEALTTAFIAGATHDLGYISPHREPENIDNAITYFQHTATQLGFNNKQKQFGEQLIRNTQNTPKPKQYTAQHTDMWIVHDADLSVWFNITPEEAYYLCQGLEKEQHTNINLESTLNFLTHKGMGTYTGQANLEKFQQACHHYPKTKYWMEQYPV